MFEDFDLESVLSSPTAPRLETIVEESVQESTGLEFDSEIIPEAVVEEVEEEYDAVQEAEKLIAMIAAANNLLMTPLAVWKLKKKRGGKASIARMEALKAKQFSGAELSEAEKNLVLQYDAYLRDRESLQSVIPYTKEEIQMLKELAIPYCQGSKMKINSGFAFWAALGGTQLSRIMAIIQA